MRALWSEQAQFESWLEVELAACEAWAEMGVIPEEDVRLLREKASFSIDRIHEIEETTKHDVVAFTRAVSETPARHSLCETDERRRRREMAATVTGTSTQKERQQQNNH